MPARQLYGLHKPVHWQSNKLRNHYGSCLAGPGAAPTSDLQESGAFKSRTSEARSSKRAAPPRVRMRSTSLTRRFILQHLLVPQEQRGAEANWTPDPHPGRRATLQPQKGKQRGATARFPDEGSRPRGSTSQEGRSKSQWAWAPSSAQSQVIATHHTSGGELLDETNGRASDLLSAAKRKAVEAEASRVDAVATKGRPDPESGRTGADALLPPGRAVEASSASIHLRVMERAAQSRHKTCDRQVQPSTRRRRGLRAPR